MTATTAAAQTRVPVLDGVRGLAILLVVISHASWPVLKFGGIAGVTLFFVLSGYLITGILVRERSATGRIRFREFYRRRALRLLPAITVVCIAYVPLAVATGVDLRVALQAVTATLLYFANIAQATTWPMADLGHMWSLSMEEQFYLVWPLLLLGLLALRRRTVALVLVLLIGASLATKGLYGWEDREGYRSAYYLPWANAWALLAGAGLALRAQWRPRAAPAWAAAAGSTALLLVAGPMGLLNGIHSGVNYGQRLLAGVLAGAVSVLLVWAVTTRPTGHVWRWLQHPWLIFLGHISYGLYLWHATIDGPLQRTLGLQGDWGNLASDTLASLLAVPIAYGSYRWVELPFLRRKDQAVPVRSQKTALRS